MEEKCQCFEMCVHILLYNLIAKIVFFPLFVGLIGEKYETEENPGGNNWISLQHMNVNCTKWILIVLLVHKSINVLMTGSSLCTYLLNLSYEFCMNNNCYYSLLSKCKKRLQKLKGLTVGGAENAADNWERADFCRANGILYCRTRPIWDCPLMAVSISVFIAVLSS